MFKILTLSMLFAMYSQFRVTSSFNKYSTIQNKNEYRGVDVANGILRSNGIHDVHIERVKGHLTDHYDARTKTIRLSESVYHSKSLSAVAVAAHEVGHAIQDHEDYKYLRIRHRLVPIVNLTSQLVWLLIFIGVLINATHLINLGILFFSLTVVFQLVTLPVEFDASQRAMMNLEEGLYIRTEEVPGTKKVLKAAALTYVAGTIYSLVNLIRLMSIKNNNKK